MYTSSCFDNLIKQTVILSFCWKPFVFDCGNLLGIRYINKFFGKFLLILISQGILAFSFQSMFCVSDIFYAMYHHDIGTPHKISWY